MTRNMNLFHMVYGFLDPWRYMHAHHLIRSDHALNVVLLHSKPVTKLMAEMQDLLLWFVM